MTGNRGRFKKSGKNKAIMRALFFNPPFKKRYDSAGARFQATRRSRSMWYPVWLAHGCAVSAHRSDLLDGPAEDIPREEGIQRAAQYDVVVFYTSTSSFKNDAQLAAEVKKLNPDSVIVFTGPHASAVPEKCLQLGPAIDVVTINEFDFTIKDILDGKPLKDVAGIVWRNGDGFVRNSIRPRVEDMDSLPFIAPIYKKYLPIDSYYLPFALRPYLSLFSGRGCPYYCTFCVWPHTFTGRDYRKRSIPNVLEEMRFVKKELPRVKEIFFDDDTFTVDKEWVMEFCEAAEPLKMTWSVNARADIPFKVLKRMRQAGCRLMVVGYESGNQQILNNIKKGTKVTRYVEFTRDANRAGLMIHGTFILGLTGESQKTIRETIDFAKSLKLDTVQCSIITALPGTELYERARRDGHLHNPDKMLTDDGFQLSPVNYPDASQEEIQKGARDFHREFYMRPQYFGRLVQHCLKGPSEAQRVFSVGWEYVKFVSRHRHF